MVRRKIFACCVAVPALLCVPREGLAQRPEPTPGGAFAANQGSLPVPQGSDPGRTTGAATSDAPNQRIRVTVELLMGFSHDGAQQDLGFVNQARMGYAIISVEGRLGSRAYYRVAINPIDETRPVPACGEQGYFFPNAAAIFDSGPRVSCEAKGQRIVDMYRFVALDNLPQQGPLRESYIGFAPGGDTDVRIGRFVLPLGFNWEEAGSLTAKDSTRIQRIDADASFGVVSTTQLQRHDHRFAAATVAVTLGDSHRAADYNYFYFADPTLSSKSTPTFIATGTVTPFTALEIRAGFKRGVSGSKVERLPNYWASKRNDNAVVLSGRFRPTSHTSLFGEWGLFEWGPTRTSAQLLDVDPQPIRKTGYYLGANVDWPLPRSARLGATLTHEELSRADSLVKWAASQNLYRVSLGKKDRSTIIRMQLQVGQVTAAVYRNIESNPFPWLSGITPVEGPLAYRPVDTSKWGLVLRMRTSITFRNGG